MGRLASKQGHFHGRKILYETLHPRNKEVGVIIALQTLRLMGSGALAFDPETYRIPIMQPTGTKRNRRQVNRKYYLSSVLEGAREAMVKLWRQKRTKGRRRYKAQRKRRRSQTGRWLNGPRGRRRNSRHRQRP